MTEKQAQTVWVNVRLTEQTHQALQKEAKANYRSASAEARLAIEAHLASRGGKGRSK